jgi:putative ABC transport system permease protein
MPMQPASQPVVDRANRQGGFFKIVTPSYFHALGMTVLKGRALSDRDVKGGPPSMVMNTRLAARYFKDKNPIGERILVQEIVPGKTELGPEIAWEVVGVVADEKISGLNDETSAGVYVSNDQSPVYGLNLVVRANLDPLTLQKSVTQAIHSVNKNQVVNDVRTLEQIKSSTLLGNRLQAGLLLTFATVALLLAAIGIYGVMSYSVAQRSHEMGIRAALGASAGSLQKLVFTRAIMLTVIGLVIGIGGSLGLTRLMETILYGVGARDPMTMILVGAILAVVAMLACHAPARCATKADPMVALRSE